MLFSFKFVESVSVWVIARANKIKTPKRFKELIASHRIGLRASGMNRKLKLMSLIS